MNIVLIGYRGTGKSHVGKLLAKQLDLEFVSMDEEIVRDAGMGIPQIVEAKGWEGFRNLETAQVRRLADRDELVIDCGGGVIERAENIAILRQNARLFWLQASVPTILRRIRGDTERPSLTAGKSFTEEVAEVLHRRTPLYRAAAHHEIDTDGTSPRRIADIIAALWRQDHQHSK